MNFIYFIIVIGLLVVISEILALGLRITGLDRDKARFQVISIITSSGFTTRESELITQHPVRRKLAELLMIIGYAGQASIIGLIFSVVTTQFTNMKLTIGTTILIVFLLFFISRNKWVIRKIELFYENRFNRQTEKNKQRTAEEVLKLNSEYGVVEFIIDDKHPLAGVKLEKSGLKQKEVQVLNIERGDLIQQFPTKDCSFKQGDRVVVYGKLENIKEIAMPNFTDA